jgi:hypothetical protein
VPPASLSRAAWSLSSIRILVIAWASILVLVAVTAATRFVTFGALAATLIISLVLLALTFFLLVEASWDLVEPAVGYLVGAVHDTTQYEFLHLGLVESGVWRCLVRGRSIACLCLIFVSSQCVAVLLQVDAASGKSHAGTSLDWPHLRLLHVLFTCFPGNRIACRSEVRSHAMYVWDALMYTQHSVAQ